MKKKTLIIIFLLSSLNSFAQKKLIIVCNEENEGLPFVTIKLLRAKIFSASDLEGRFVLDCTLNDSLEIQSLGYKSVKYEIEKIKNFTNDTINLERKFIDLKEIWVMPDYKGKDYLLGEWNNKNAKSSVKCGLGEVATFYNIKSENGFVLKEVRLFVNDFNNSEVITARLQVNKAIVINKKLIPSDTNLLNKDYILEVNKKNTWYTILLDTTYNNLIKCDSIFIKIQFLNIDYLDSQGWIIDRKSVV